MILIVDSGSTKCDWKAVDNQGNQLLEKIRTKGLNPALLSEKKIKKVLKKSEALKKHRKEVTNIYFYGAGCGTENPKLVLKLVLHEFFPNAEISVEEDTMAAVFATVNEPTEAAVVCIMGTGSNCSYYDGKKLHQRVKSLGYTLMDDASGNYYGKELIRDYYFNHMPEEIKVAFGDKYNLDADYIKYNLYKQPNPNAYLASFAEFMILNKDSDYVKELIKKGIRRFAKNMILQYEEELKTVPVHFAGSIAFFCQEEIKEVAKELNFTVGNFERRPIEGLVSFHTNAS
ncbi:N-acetylglucosamine kinase-like BadF-type ATPase [Mesoflavibacter sabulilitoris]|uniref:N-acetylglucosamine kinase n=1 Tax=Mesoflavibacter zeaxanthinifaciens subsp. sabulilitoris TaxID=1520893 RepID=A0A2T1NGG9_9FLAO|nr:N-acetylglucosamine kinase [Mesoflavibacter zeaxanthinifaciens]MBB3123006.1 N-acetylglucosamine kinase-like BadF-type ATPase [Mesoflavibacter zeaxanthinifaciens subsp. sabulilitoris]MCP4053160.1 N-acetylglucosamine kinase [Mesoflavibacter sp.]PSG91924.1 N-acetylglucosamine kinase [Mesoflavibacter zeaxanthinifaciens subsp. sabulilitoris]